MSNNYFGYIYRTFSPASGQFYIGQRVGCFNPEYFGSGVRISRWIRKYGKASLSVDVLRFCQSKQELDREEIRFIQIYREFGFDLLNIANGGQGGGFSGKPMPDWVKKKISAKARLRTGPLAFHSKESREKARITNTGKKRSEAHKEKFRIAQSSRPAFTKEARIAMRNARLGRKFSPLSDEHKANLSKSNKDSFEKRRHLAPGVTNKPGVGCRIIEMRRSGFTHKLIAESIGVSKTCITRFLAGGRSQNKRSK